MKIAINGLGVNGGGGKTYLEHFLPALLKADAHFEYYVLLKAGVPALGLPAHSRLRVIPVKLASNLASRFYREQVWLPRWLKREQIDILFSPADSTSLLAPCPVVLAMRNMNLYVKREKGWSLPFQIKFYALSALARFSAKIARKIVFVSETSKKIIARQLNIAADKQKLVYHGVSPIFFERVKKIPDELQWLRDTSPYLLSVSSIYRYKNFLRLIEAFQIFKKNDPENHHLIITGKPYDKPYFQEIKQIIAKNRLEPWIHLTGEIHYAHLPALYQHASLFVFPSYLETFGHPLVEAMAAGLPIAAANIENSKEIAGNAALYFNPHDTEDIAETLKKAIKEKEIRQRLIANTSKQAKHFSWDRCAQETLAVFKEAL